MMKLIQYSAKEPCYFCGTPPPSTREHVPPKMLFKGTKYSAISVPSCEKHNYEKHGHDQGFVSALAVAVRKVREIHQAADPLSTEDDAPVINVPEGVVRRVGSLKRYLLDAPRDIDTDLPYIDVIADLKDWIRHISAGLLWARLGPKATLLDWEEAIVRSPNIVRTDSPVSIQEAGEHNDFVQRILHLSDSLVWNPGWFRKPHGYPSQIYKFAISSFKTETQSEPPHLIFRHEFLRNFTFFLLVECGAKTRDKVIS